MTEIRYGHDEHIVTLDALQREVGPGWAPLLERLVADLFDLRWDGRVLQVKPKFGSLRFRLPAGVDEKLFE